MESKENQSRTGILIGVVVAVVLLVFIFMKAGEVKKENSLGPRTGQPTNTASK